MTRHARVHANTLQGVRHPKSAAVIDEIKTQLKDKVEPAGSPLADVIVAAGKDKLSKKPDDKQTSLTSEPHLLGSFCNQSSSSVA